MAGFSKKELAERSNISRQSITNWEGVRPPEAGIDADQLNRLSAALRGTEGEYPVAEMLVDLGYRFRPLAVEDEKQESLLRQFRVAPPYVQAQALAGLRAALRDLEIEVE